MECFRYLEMDGTMGAEGSNWVGKGFEVLGALRSMEREGPLSVSVRA